MTYNAPAVYDRLIGPRYGPIAEALVEAAVLRVEDDVLELGAGTGLVTRRVAPLVRSLLVTDLSDEMLGVARHSLARQPNVSYVLLDYGHAFPFLKRSFSLVLAGLTFVQNSASSLLEVARVSRPSGRLALSMWGPTYHEKQLLNAALGSIGGGRFPDAAPSRAVKRLERGGFRTVRRTDVALSTRFPSVADYLNYRRGFGIPLLWTPAYYERFLCAVERESSRTVEADGSFTLGWTVSLITARAPRSFS
jgi:SAM-dependent methyltransferase